MILDVDVEIEYVAEPLFPAAVNGADVNGDTNMVAPAADAAANAEEDDGQDLQAVMRRFQDRASTTYVVTDEETNNEGGDDNKGSKEVKDTDDEALEDENGEMLSKRKLKVSFCAHLVLILFVLSVFIANTVKVSLLCIVIVCSMIHIFILYLLYLIHLLTHTHTNNHTLGYATTNSCTIETKCITSRISRST